MNGILTRGTLVSSETRRSPFETARTIRRLPDCEQGFTESK